MHIGTSIYSFVNQHNNETYMYARWMTTHGVKPNCAKITFLANLNFCIADKSA